MGGCYNSGTTILREILGAHPAIAVLPREGVDMTSAFIDLESGGWERMWWKNRSSLEEWHPNPTQVAEEAKRDWNIWWKKGAIVNLEKSICHAAWFRTLNDGFPECKFIGVVRNGYCVAEGIRRKARPRDAAAIQLGRTTYSIDEAAEQWVQANERMIKDTAGMTNCLEVRYEDLTSNPLDTICRICDFIGVSKHVYTQTEGGVSVLGRVFDVRNDNLASYNRLSEQDKLDFDTVANATMRKLGYGSPT